MRKNKAYHKKHKKVYEIISINFEKENCILRYDFEQTFNVDFQDIIFIEFAGLLDNNKEEIYTFYQLTNNLNAKGTVHFENGKFKCIMSYKNSEQIFNFELMNVNNCCTILKENGNPLFNFPE